MARPKKVGLEYYPQDTDIHSDIKIRRLRNEFGASGYMVYDYVKCLCYKENGYWLKYDDGFCFDVADVLKSGTTENSVMEILRGCFRMDLFNRDLFKAFRVISSRGIQKRFLEVRKGHLLLTEYDLLSAKNEVIDELSTENDPLSPKGKESKGNEMKEKENKLFFGCVRDWNLFAEKHGKPKIEDLTDKRTTKLRKRFTEKKFDLQKILIIADKSEFITCDKGAWFTFDWVIESESNYIKVLEGNFSKNGKGTNAAGKYTDLENELAATINGTANKQ